MAFYITGYSNQPKNFRKVFLSFHNGSQHNGKKYFDMFLRDIQCKENLEMETNIVVLMNVINILKFYDATSD